MKKIIDWLMYVELLSAELYSEAAAFFRDPSLVKFLRRSAEDETFHHQMMATAHDAMDAAPEIEPAFDIDEDIKAPIENKLLETIAKVRTKSLSREMMFDCIVDTEYSEWNEIFLYVVNTLKSINPAFNPVAAKIQGHLKYIEHYLNSDDYGRQKIKIIKKLEPVWEERILIIDDDAAITKLLAAVLKDEGVIDTAENGEAGLAKIQQNYCRMIISDVDMPLIDGITLFHKVHKMYPGIQDRYLFFTGNPSSETMTFLRSHDLKFLLKPASIQELKKQVMATMHDIS